MAVFTNIIPKKETRAAYLGALKIISRVLESSYGPYGSITAMRRLKAMTEYSKDGHTILKEVRFNQPIEMTMKDDMVSITEHISKTVGDGTTSATILAYLIFKALVDAVEKYNLTDMHVVKELQRVIKEAIEIIESNKKETTSEDIYKIAYTSSNGNEEVAQNMKNIYEKYGMDVYVHTGISNTENTVLKIYDGITIEAGFADPAFINSKTKTVSSIRNPKIYVFEDPIDTPEMKVFMDKIIYDNIFKPSQERNMKEIVPTVIFCPKLSADMNSTIDGLIDMFKQAPADQRLPFLLVTNTYKIDWLRDLIYLSGGKTIKKYIDPNMQKIDVENGLAPTLETIHNFAGEAELVEADAEKTKIVNPKDMVDAKGEKTEKYLNYVRDLESTLVYYEETKEELVKMDMLRRRINSLKANMVDYLVGGISQAKRDADMHLVEDAVLCCRSAARDGYGFGANFEGLRAFNYLENKFFSGMADEEKKEASGKFNIYSIMLKAYVELVIKLYNTYTNDEDKAIKLVVESLKNGCPFNMRSEEFDGLVLSSIKSEVVILDAISKILGMVFTTNQYLCEAPEYNVYVDPEE